MRSITWVAVLGMAGLFAAPAFADENTGIYAGLSVGQSKTDFSDDIDDLFDGEDTAFKLVGGYRILDWFGVEVSYVDLGEITLEDDLRSIGTFRLEQAGFDAYGVFFWNLGPVDLFAKGGLIVSQLHLRTDTGSGPFRFIVDETDNGTDLAWGAGGQVRFGKIAVRAEYEHFDFDDSAGFEAPDFFSLGFTYTFF